MIEDEIVPDLVTRDQCSPKKCSDFNGAPHKLIDKSEFELSKAKLDEALSKIEKKERNLLKVDTDLAKSLSPKSNNPLASPEISS